jgi:hypothetical protein
MSRAAVFTHLDERNRLEDQNEFAGFYRRHGGFFQSCLRCRNIGIVFLYSSSGIEQYLAALEESGSDVDVRIPMTMLEKEQRIYNALQVAVDRAIVDVRREDPSWSRADGPEFVFIGVRELACHMNRLLRMNGDLLKNFAYCGKFTYDSPKYVEAILRIGRARQFPEETIIRVDADVLVNEKAVDVLLKQAAICRAEKNKLYWWFSGCYFGNTDHDPINEHAVRQHWLITRKSRRDGKGKYQLVKGGEHFLADIAEVGATQYGWLDEETKPLPAVSRAARTLMKERGPLKSEPLKSDHSKRRASAQVISGAGLVASYGAIHRLPPFMNAKAMVVWIDDHLKRRLHEAIGDIFPDEPERLSGAAMRQDRFPDGIPDSFIANAHQYFERLMLGCLMEATIQTAEGTPGPLAEWVRRVVTATLKEFSPEEKQKLRSKLSTAATERYQQVIKLWKTANYGNDILATWAANPTGGDLCGDAVEIGVSYIDLCLAWPNHVTAIENLSAYEAYWLFTTGKETEAEVVIAGGDARIPIAAAKTTTDATSDQVRSSPDSLTESQPPK